MKMKNMIAVLSAMAVSAVGMSAMTFSASAADVIGVASLNGQMGTYQKWDQEGAAEITGDGQYVATWDIVGDGTGTIEFLILEVKGSNPDDENLMNFTKDQYVDLDITIDEIAIDGTVFEYTTNDAAYNFSHYEGGTGRSRIYLTETWGSVNAGEDLGVQAAVTQQIKVTFTVSGTGVAAETPEEPQPEESSTPEEESSAADESSSTADSSSAADSSSTTSSTTSTTSSTTSTTTTTNTNTGDAGVAALLAAVAAAGAAVVVTAKKNK